MGFLFFLEIHDSGYVFAGAVLALCSHPDISTAVACQSQEPEGSVLMQDVWAELAVAPVLRVRPWVKQTPKTHRRQAQEKSSVLVSPRGPGNGRCGGHGAPAIHGQCPARLLSSHGRHQLQAFVLGTGRALPTLLRAAHDPFHDHRIPPSQLCLSFPKG